MFAGALLLLYCHEITHEIRYLKVPIRFYKLPILYLISGVPCPQGWVRFKGYCYIVSSSIKTWQNAQAYCKELGGNLVKINSKEGNDRVCTKPRKQARPIAEADLDRTRVEFSPKGLRVVRSFSSYLHQMVPT